MSGTEQFILTAMIFAVALLAAVFVPIAIQRLPSDYLSGIGRPPSSERAVQQGLRSIAGALLAIVGVLLFFRWPIRALMMLVAGFAATSFPGKHHVIRRLLAIASFRDLVNGIRDAGNVPPLRRPATPAAADSDLKEALAQRLAQVQATPARAPEPAVGFDEPDDESIETSATLEFAPNVDWDAVHDEVEATANRSRERHGDPDDPEPLADRRPPSVSVDSMTLSQASLASPYLRDPGEGAGAFAFDPRAASKSGYHHGRKSFPPPRRSPTQSAAIVGSRVNYSDGDPLFTAYLAVSWNATSRPGRGKNTVWWCAVERDKAGETSTRLENPSTRAKALEQIGDLFADWVERGVSGIGAFAFPFGFPRGFGQATGVRSPRWRGTWELISGRIRDEQIGKKWNNRFEAADSLNKLVTGDGPFWSHPPSQEFESLFRTPPDAPTIPLTRHCDSLLDEPSSVWKLMYGGASGSEALLGIPYVQHLSTAIELEDAVTVWPFDRGSTKPVVSITPRILLAETIIDLSTVSADGDLPPDAVGTRTLAQGFERLDRKGELAPFLAAPDGLPDEIRKDVVTEEGWVLGIPAPDPTHWG